MIKLSQDEFLERLARNMPLIKLALKKDLENNYPVEMHDLIARVLIRTVELIYQE